MRNQITGKPAQQRAANRDDDREPGHQLQNDGAAANDDRYAQQKAENDKRHIALGGGCNGHRIVETHHKISDDNGAHSVIEAG